MKNRLREFKERLNPEDERGQAIIVIAFAMIALLLFAGLALDAATIYSGQTRLKRAVDAAALAAVVELPNEVGARNRTVQFLAANGFGSDNLVGSPLTARVPASGLLQWAVTATHRVPLVFLPLINFNHVDVTESAVAEYRSMIDIYTSQTGGQEFVGPTTLFNYGRWANPRFGDAITPQCYTCVAGCDEYGAGRYSCPAGPNPDHSELYNESGQGYSFNIQIPEGYSSDDIQIEILDPDGYNRGIDEAIEIKHTNGVTVTGSERIELGDIDCNDSLAGNQNQRMDPCFIATGDLANPYWFMRLDQTRSFGGQPATYDSAYNTETHYRLFYLKQLPDRSILKMLLATYVGGAADSSTDLRWHSPPGWTLDIDCDDGSCAVSNIVENRDGSRSLLLEVDGVSGYSKNAFDLWAGPPPTESIPSDVNERNLYLLEHRAAYDTGGVIIYARGYLPLSINGYVDGDISGGTPITMTYGFIPIEATGAWINVFHFDNDATQQVIDYYLEGVGGWNEQGTLSLDGTWSETQNYVYQPPGSRDHDHLQVPSEFFSGYLHGRYTPVYNDASTWVFEYEGMVGEVFVRLIE